VLDRAKALGKVKSLYVFHTLKGRPFTASALNSAWRRALERAGVKDAWFRDLRPKALSDAKRQGLSLERVRDAAGHALVSTTEDYMRGFNVKEANLGLTLPKTGKSG
jgi:integrase